MKKSLISIPLAFLLLSAFVVSLPLYKAYALPPATEIFTFAPQKDSFIKQGSEKDNEGANIVLDIQSSDKHRPVIAFDLNQMNQSANGRPVQSAILRLYATENGNNWSPDGNTIGVYRLLTNWQEGNGWNFGNNIKGTGSGVTWACPTDTDISNNQNDCGTQWNGGSFTSVVTSNVLITNNITSQWVEFDVTSDVQAFLNGTATNYGWIIKKTGVSLNGDIAFASKEATANDPSLVITFVNSEVVLANEYLTIITELDEVGRSLNDTEITQELVNNINLDLVRLKEVVVELQNLGFDGESWDGRVASQMFGFVRFYNENTNSTLFQVQIPHGTMGIFAIMGLAQEYASENAPFTSNQTTSLLRGSYALALALSNYQDDQIASEFVLSGIHAFHPSTGDTFKDKLFRKLAEVIARCLSFEPCDQVVDDVAEQLIEEGYLQLWYLSIDEIMPLGTVTGIVFNDINGDGVRGDPSLEHGLSGIELMLWAYRGTTFDSESAIPLKMLTTNSNGSFGYIEGRVPNYTENLRLIQQNIEEGWAQTVTSGSNGWIVHTTNRSIQDHVYVNPPPQEDYVTGDAYFGNFQEDPLTSGLVGWWKLDDGSGTAAADSSGNGNTGSLVNGPTWSGGSSCIVGSGCLTLDGSNDYVSVADSSSLEPSRYTLSAWVKVAEHPTTGELYPIIQKGTSDGNFDRNGYMLDYRDIGGVKKLSVYHVDSNNGFQQFLVDYTLNVGQWYHIAGTYDGSQTRLYVNGAQIGSLSTNIDPSYAGDYQTLKIGTFDDLVLTYFKGNIDDVRIYNKALTALEIGELSQPILNVGLVGHWKLDENSGTTAADSSGNGNTGTLNGPTWSSSCELGSCLSFDGSDYVDVPDSSTLEGMSDLTISAWIKRGSIDGNLQVFVAKGRLSGTATSSYGLWMYSDNRVLFGLDTGSNIATIGLTTITDTNTWHLITATYTSGSMILYVDGEVSQSYNGLSGTVYSTADPFTIAKRAGNSPLNFSGHIDDVRVYDRVLSPEEVETLYLQ